MQKVGVVDYDAGNLRSVETALEHLGADFLVSQDPEVLKDCDRLIFSRGRGCGGFHGGASANRVGFLP
jgi:imidazoleglycerol phosphate synthase glutamine amidotransferase subunit HisH